MLSDDIKPTTYCDVHVTYSYTNNALTAMYGGRVKTVPALSTDLQTEAAVLAAVVSGASNLALVMYADDVFVFRG